MGKTRRVYPRRKARCAPLQPVVLEKESFRKSVGEKIRCKRLGMDISQTELATACGISYSNLSRIESGEYGLTFDNAAKLAQILKLDLNTLLEPELLDSA